MPDKPENSAFKLLSSRKTLVMATADNNGSPNVSYAPFVHALPPRTRHAPAAGHQRKAACVSDDQKSLKALRLSREFADIC